MSLRKSGRRREDHYDVIADGSVVGRRMLFSAEPAGLPWMWTVAPGYEADRSQTHGYEATKEAALKACARARVRVMGSYLDPGVAEKSGSSTQHGEPHRSPGCKDRPRAIQAIFAQQWRPSQPAVTAGLLQLRPRLLLVPALLEVCLCFFQGRRSIRARHRTVHGQPSNQRRQIAQARAFLAEMAR
jgi:hypothetical protein